MCYWWLVQVRRLKTSMQYKEAQHSHEMRKREKEYSRLKVKLGQVCTAPSPLYPPLPLHPSLLSLSPPPSPSLPTLPPLPPAGVRSEPRASSWSQCSEYTPEIWRQEKTLGPAGKVSGLILILTYTHVPRLPFLLSALSLSSSVEDTYRTIVSSYEERQKVRSSLS